MIKRFEGKLVRKPGSLAGGGGVRSTRDRRAREAEEIGRGGNYNKKDNYKNTIEIINKNNNNIISYDFNEALSIYTRIPLMGIGLEPPKISNSPTASPKSLPSLVTPSKTPEEIAEENKQAEIQRQEEEQRKKAQKEADRKKELRDAQSEAERLRLLAAEYGWEIDENGEPQITLESYNIYDPEQIAMVVDQVKPTHDAAILDWGKRIEYETEEVKRDTQYIRDVASVPANAHTSEMIAVIRSAIKLEEELENKSLLSRLFSSLAFWKSKEPSHSRDLVVVESARDRIVNAIDRSRALQEAINEDIEFRIDQIRYCDEKKEGHEKVGDALQVHIDATDKIYRNLLRAHDKGEITKFGEQDPTDIRAEVEGNVEKRKGELTITRGHLMVSYATLESVQETHVVNRVHLVETKNVNETMVMQSLMGLLNIEESISDTMAQMAADQSRAKALKAKIDELKARQQEETAKISTGLDEVSETLETFARINDNLVIGNAEGAKRVIDNAHARKGFLKIAGPEESNPVLALPKPDS